MILTISLIFRRLKPIASVATNRYIGNGHGMRKKVRSNRIYKWLQNLTPDEAKDGSYTPAEYSGGARTAPQSAAAAGEPTVIEL